VEINTLGIAGCSDTTRTGPRRGSKLAGCVQAKQPGAGSTPAATAHPGTGRYSSQQESKELPQHKQGMLQPTGPVRTNRAEHPAGKPERTQLPAGMEPSPLGRNPPVSPPGRWPETRPGVGSLRLSSTQPSCPSGRRWHLRSDRPIGLIRSGNALIPLLP